MEVKTILYATDVEELHFKDVEFLLNFLGLGLKEVVFLHAAKMEGWEEALAGSGISTKAFQAKGLMATTILDTAQRESVSLIAVNINRSLDGRPRGSLAKALFRSSPVPVIIFSEGLEKSGSKKQGLLTHVVFATDWSVVSEKALSYLVNLKAGISALEIVHVIEKRLSIKDMRDIKDRLAQTRTTFLDAGVDAEPHIYAGKPSEEILLAAKDYHASCIVMGINRKSRMKELVNKSEAIRVADATEDPILVVP